MPPVTNTKVDIFYNGLDIFTPQTTPLVGFSYNELYFNEQWCKEETITLEGQLTGCTFDLINEAQQILVTGLAANYKSFEIKQNNSSVFSRPCVQVESISFPSQPWLGVMPYTITIKNYPSDFFTGTYGIINPSDTWSYVEQQNEVLEATHTVSCVGFNTTVGSNNALDNAKAFVAARLGTSSWIPPQFIPNFTNANFFLRSEEENIDRFNGTYSVTQKYLNDLTRVGYGTIRYQTVLEQGAQNNLIQVTVNGEVVGLTDDISNIRNTFNSFSPIGVASQAADIIFQNTKLNATPVTFAVNEDLFNGKINFSYQFNDDNADNIIFDFTVTMSQAYGSRNIISLNGQISARKGDVQARSDAVKDFLGTLDADSLFIKVLPFFVGQNLGTLNPYPITQSYSLNPNDGTASVNIEFDDSTVYPGLNRFDGSISVTAPVTQLDIQPILDGAGALSVIDLGYSTRGEISVQGQGQSDGEGDEAIKNTGMTLFNQAGVGGSDISLDQNVINELDSDAKNVSCNFRWSFNGSSVAHGDTITI